MPCPILLCRAVMEAAISSSLSHPNIVQTYTYTIRPMRDNSQAQVVHSSDGNALPNPAEATYETTQREPNSGGSGGSTNVHSYEVRCASAVCAAKCGGPRVPWQDMHCIHYNSMQHAFPLPPFAGTQAPGFLVCTSLLYLC